MKVLNFGSCNLDYVYALDHIVVPGETEDSRGMQIFPGGKGLNQSIAAARAGSPVFHAGVVGSDGDLLLQTMEQSGVDTSCVKRTDAKNGHAIIQVTAAGENSILLYAGSNGMVTGELVDEVLAQFAAGDILMLQNEINMVDTLIEKAYAKGMRILLNPSPFNEKIKGMDLHKVWCLILNEVEAMGFSGTGDVQESLDYFQSCYPKLKVMLTLGKNGAVYMEDGKRTYQAAFCVDAVDTTAAGDTFTGYFVAGQCAHLPAEDILRQATAASAICVTRDGAAPSIPSMEEVKRFLDMA